MSSKTMFEKDRLAGKTGIPKIPVAVPTWKGSMYCMSVDKARRFAKDIIEVCDEIEAEAARAAA